LENTFLSKEKFEELFYAILDLYKLEGRKVSIEDVGNFSVRKSKKQIVCPENKIEKTSIKRIFQLIDHEI
jgi:nucleoid DNA-binding protein